jgi:coatomer subunit beta'
VAIGYDEGSVMIKLGREEPAVSMDRSGKIIWVKNLKMQEAHLKALTVDEEAIKDGDQLPLSVKDIGTCDIYPQRRQSR